jgi:hypothetical protein
MAAVRRSAERGVCKKGVLYKDGGSRPQLVGWDERTELGRARAPLLFLILGGSVELGAARLGPKVSLLAH